MKIGTAVVPVGAQVECEFDGLGAFIGTITANHRRRGKGKKDGFEVYFDVDNTTEVVVPGQHRYRVIQAAPVEPARPLKTAAGPIHLDAELWVRYPDDNNWYAGVVTRLHPNGAAPAITVTYPRTSGWLECSEKLALAEIKPSRVKIKPRKRKEPVASSSPALAWEDFAGGMRYLKNAVVPPAIAAALRKQERHPQKVRLTGLHGPTSRDLAQLFE